MPQRGLVNLNNFRLVKSHPNRVFSNAIGLATTNDLEYSNFRLLGIGKPSAKQVARKELRTEAKKERKGLSVAARINNIVQKYNPAIAVPRGSFLTGLRFNLFGISRRLYPALLTDAELKAGNFNLENAARAKKLLNDKIKPFWVKNLGGRSSSLEKEIRLGHDKPIFNKKKMKAKNAKEKSGGFDGEIFNEDDDLGFGAAMIEILETSPDFENFIDAPIEEYSNYTEEAIAGYITAGLTIAAKVVSMLNKGGANKNPYNSNPTVAADIAANDETPQESPAELAKLEAAANENKILGISKEWFYGGLIGITALSITGFLIYKYVKK